MKLIVKNLKGNQFEIEIEPSFTVKQVKEKIEEEEKISVESQKLVAIGKVMDDAKTVEDYKLKDGDFIVVMVAKPKVEKKAKPEPTPAPTTTSTSTVPTGTNASASTGGNARLPAMSQPPAPVPNPTTSSSASSPVVTGQEDSSGILRGEALENTLKEMQDMGFARDECMRALRAAYYNADRAVDYLLNGIPADLQEQPQPSHHSHSHGTSHSSSNTGSGSGAATTGGGDGSNPLAFLQNNPMFAQIRQRLINEPQFFQTFMNTLAQTQPQLHQAISQNPQAFLQLLLGGGGDADQEHDPPGTIRVTQEEKDAIERLAALGFPKHRAIEAYLACDKNEEWAANYLFENVAIDDNYDDQVVQEESRAEAEEQDLAGHFDEANSPRIAHQEIGNPPANNPDDNDDMNVDQPDNADGKDDSKPSDSQNNEKKDDNDDEEGSSL